MSLSAPACLVFAVFAAATNLRSQTPPPRAGSAIATQVTTDPGVDIDPVITPDGKNVVYASSRSGSLELWMRPLGGGAFFQLTSTVNSSADRNPSITPDGATVVFQSDRVSSVRNIWAIDLKSRALMQLTNVNDGASNPSVSSKGEICYTRSYASGVLSIWVMGMDGSNARELGPGLDCAWSPDGRFVVFSRNSSSRAGAEQYDLWMTDSDGQNGRLVVSTPRTWERAPVVSPDGKSVTFTSYEGAFSTDLEEVAGGFQVRAGLITSLWSASLYGEGPPVQLTEPTAFNSYATYSPDGASIIFTSTRSGSADLWSIRARR